MKTIKQWTFAGITALVFCATVFALSIVPKPTPADVAGVWFGYLNDETYFARLELETNGTGYLCISPLPSIAHLYAVERWSVSDFTVELRTKDIPTPLNRDADIRKFHYERGRFLQGQMDMHGVQRTMKLYSEREWQARSTSAQKHIARWRKDKILD
jgi:hypothetical protein